MLILEKFELSACLDRRVLVARVCRREFSGADLQDSDPDRDEHLHSVVGTQRLVRLCQDLARVPAEHRAALDYDLRDHHEQRRGDSLAADIRDHHAQMILINKEEIVEIAADLPGRIHHSVDIERAALRQSRENAGQHALLDLVGHVQFRADPLLLRSDTPHLGHVFHRPVGQFGKRFRQHLYLTVRPIRVFHHEFQVGLIQARDPLRDQVQGPHDLFAEDQRRNKGQNRYDQQEQRHCAPDRFHS